MIIVYRLYNFYVSW